MKRKELIKTLEREGCYLKRHGANHDIYHNPKTNRSAPIARHSEIPDTLCKLIFKQLEISKNN
ncbi:MAG: type II toxin-antitoxin system HicA family toxin [Ignavibacteriales bacterium]|nr:type II toxin-antitoxin system HicA family toxin [Ignavibacteriales bacterium]